MNETVGVVRERERERVRLEKKDSLLKDVKTISYVNEDIRWTVWRESNRLEKIALICDVIKWKKYITNKDKYA